MKKIIATLSILLVCAIAVKAQDYKSIWGKGRYTHISYAIAQTGTDFEDVQKAQFGFAVTKGATFLFPKTPLWGHVKFGFDVNWVDISMAKYKSSSLWDVDLSQEVDDNDDEWGALSDLMNVGRWSIMIGALGVGPNISATPFASFNNAAKYIKTSIYFHYQPTFGMYLVSDKDDTEASMAYCNMFQFGGCIQWKFIGIGIEGHWGSGKFKQLDFEGDDYEGNFFEGKHSNKINRKFASTRIYLSLSF